jgi:hypothetical protein
MTDCHREKVGLAKQRVIDELTQFRNDRSDTRLAALKAAIDNWHDKVEAWGKANTVGPTKQNLS